MKQIKRFFHFLASVFLYSILVILILIFITVIVYFIEEKSNVEQGRYISPLFSAYVIISPSMVPNIQVYDAVVDMKAIPSSIKVGDIITFVSEDALSYGKTITHRVVGLDQDSNGRFRYRTKGDNNNVADNWIVPEKNVIGKVIFRIPQLGYLQQFLSTAYGWVIAIVVPCLIIVVYDIVKLAYALITSSKKKIDNTNLKGEE